MLLNDRDQIIAMTAEWTGERYPNGRPRVSDEKIEILKNLTQEEIWQPLYSCGYRFQFQGDLKPLHPDKKLYGRAVTCCFMPQRPDLRQHVFNVARSRGWKGDCNQWVIDSLEENDVVVCDLYDKILRGTFVGGNLTTAVKARTKNGGVVVWGGVRDLEQMQNIDVQVFYRGVDPTPIRDCQITAFNGPCRIGAAICLPGDIVIGTKNGILFVPSHMVDYVIEHAYKSQVRDLYAFPKLEAGIYTTADVDAAVKDSGGFDILVSTVGVNCHCPAAEYKDEDMFRLLETNYLSGVRCARKVIPTMQARGGGSIINISSIHSLMSQPTNMLYAGTKGAMNAAARVMALDYAKDNIRVNTICPGVVISDVMYDDMDKLDDAGKKQLDAALHRCQPLEPGRMQDIANTALFFASNMSANITGQTLLSDGGTSIKAHDMDC